MNSSMTSVPSSWTGYGTGRAVLPTAGPAPRTPPAAHWPASSSRPKLGAARPWRGSRGCGGSSGPPVARVAVEQAVLGRAVALRRQQAARVPGTARSTRWTSASLPVLSTPRSVSRALRSRDDPLRRGLRPVLGEVVGGPVGAELGVVVGEQVIDASGHWGLRTGARRRDNGQREDGQVGGGHTRGSTVDIGAPPSRLRVRACARRPGQPGRGPPVAQRLFPAPLAWTPCCDSRPSSCGPCATTRPTPRCRATSCSCGPATSAGWRRASTRGCRSAWPCCRTSSASSARR